ncbi:MAG TPA: hypothetical protein VE641_09570 [Chthoniobacterales bacterium]|nr:hypothetical protein [Chthoniobacterales bacterium]
MIELQYDRLRFSFPDLHPDAKCEVSFQRTFRIPDDDKTWPLPPGLGRFPIVHVDDFTATLPPAWKERGGVAFPMYQSEAMWIAFSGNDYLFAVKIAAGKIDAVTGKPWSVDLVEEPQNYVVIPTQSWLDGFCVREGVIRQFVAMPLGAGYTAEEQITGQAEYGGLQIQVYPMRPEIYEKEIKSKRLRDHELRCDFAAICEPAPTMGLAPGGQMRQQIYLDHFGFEAWDRSHSSRCFVHLCNSLVWQSITGQLPPYPPPTANSYSKAGLPWFDYYRDDVEAAPGSSTLAELKSVSQTSQTKLDHAVPENEAFTLPPTQIRQLGKGRPVREMK